MSAEPQRQPDPGIRILSAQIAGLKRRIRDLEQADQASDRSIDDGALEVYDDDDELRARIGKQPDGAFSAKAFGKVPEIPTTPSVRSVPGGVVIGWDGTFEEAQTDDIDRVAVHIAAVENFPIVSGEDSGDDDTADTDADATERAAITSPRGAEVFVPLDPNDYGNSFERYYVKLVAVAEGGAESDPSEEVPFRVAPSEPMFWQDDYLIDEFTNVEDGIYLTYEPIANSEHMYWNGLYQREDVAWESTTPQFIRFLEHAGGMALRPGDRLTVEYAYLQPLDPPGST